MRPIEFKGQNKVFIGPEGSDILPLPAYNDGTQTTCCWQCTQEEIDLFIANGGKMWLSVFAGKNFPPVAMYPQEPTFPHLDAKSWIGYTPAIGTSAMEFLQVFNFFDVEAPQRIVVNQRLWVRTVNVAPVPFRPNERFKAGDYYLRYANEEEYKRLESERVICRINTVDTADGGPKDEQVFALKEKV